MALISEGENNQGGDRKYGNVAGRDSKTGLSGAEVGQLFEQWQEFSLSLVQAYEKLVVDQGKQIRGIAAEVELRFAEDAIQRRRRQRVLNLALAGIVVFQAIMACGFLALLWQLWPVLTETAARLVLGAIAGIAAGLYQVRR